MNAKTDKLRSMADVVQMVDRTLSKKKSGPLQLIDVSANGLATLSDDTYWSVLANDHFIVEDWGWPTEARIEGNRMIKLRDGAYVGVTARNVKL